MTTSLLRDRNARREAGEDYALRKVPDHWKRSPFSFAMSLSGLTCSVFFFALGGTLALTYGLVATLVTLVIGTLLGIAGTIAIARVTASYAVDLDLMTRGSGYGFLGSAVTSFIYALNWLMYAGLEAAFLASAINSQWHQVPLWLLYVLCSLATVPINWYGFVQNDWVQRLTWPVYLVGLGLLMAAIIGGHAAPAWNQTPLTVAGFFGALGALLPNVVIQILGTGDYARFVRRSELRAAMWQGPLVVIVLVYLFAFPLGAILALYTKETNPGIYAAGQIGVFGVVWILVTQLRINNMNFYSGSLALANFASRILRFVPGRRFWIIVVGLVTVATTELGIVNHLVEAVTTLGTFCIAWLGTLLADLFVVKPLLGGRPAHIEHRRGNLVNWGVPALVSLLAGCVVGSIFNLGRIPNADFGPFVGECLALLIGFGGPIVAHLIWSRRLDLLARDPEPAWVDDLTRSEPELEDAANQLACGVCHSVVMRQDLATCPVTDGGVICSVCCASHRTCGDRCKQEPIFQITEAELRAARPPSTVPSSAHHRA
jgi:purine-cytosine permease-like protein